MVDKGVWFLDRFRLEYLRHLRGAGQEDPEAVANAGLRIAKGKFKEFTGEQVLSMIPTSCMKSSGAR